MSNVESLHVATADSRPKVEKRPPTLTVRRCLRNDEIQLREPANIGYYSLQRGGVDSVKTQKYSEDTSQLRYLYIPPENSYCFDLTDGYIDKDWEPSGEGLTYLLRWIVNNKHKFALSSETTPCKSLNTDFICFRGLLSILMNTPYEKTADWCIHAVKINGTIFMLDQTTERKAKEEANRNEYCKKACFGGHKFEEYLCATEPNKPPKSPLDSGLNLNQFCVVFRSRLNSHSLVYGAECDCIKPGGNPKKLEFIEIKTTKEFETKRQYDTFRRYKTQKWWTQSYLAGIKTIVCGYRDDDFNVRKIETFSTNSLCRLGSEFWSPNVCLNFVDSFLKFVKECVTEENPCVTYEFYWSPNATEVKCKQLNVQDTVLPHEFREAFY